jgi:hypothetical protein
MKRFPEERDDADERPWAQRLPLGCLPAKPERPTILPVRFVTSAWRVDISHSSRPSASEASTSRGRMRSRTLLPNFVAYATEFGRAVGADSRKAGVLRRPASRNIHHRPDDPRARRSWPLPAALGIRFRTGPSQALRLVLFFGLSAFATCRVAASEPPAAAAPYRATALGLNAGGGRTSSPKYSAQSSLGEIGQTAAAPSPLVIALSGRVGQLFEATSLSVAAQPGVLAEGSQSWLSGTALLDDGTRSYLGGCDIVWRVVSGPVASIGAPGLLTAARVYQDAPARIEGRYPDILASIELKVINTGDDDFGLYAYDGILDPWQVQYFGANNAAGRADADPDGDGQNNLSEFMAGVSPTNAASRFVLEIAPLPGEPDQKLLFFSPRWADRSYLVESSADLGLGFTPMANAPVLDFGDVRLVLDPNASEVNKFYRVRISLP